MDAFMTNMIANPFLITVIFVILSAGVAAFVKGRQCDKCLKDFAGDVVTVENTAGKAIWGNLRVENTGMELTYADKQTDEDGHHKASYILYKYEYGNIQMLIRFHDQLSEAGQKQRQCQLEETYHPGFLSRQKRKTLNVFKTVRDSVMEIVNLLISNAKKATPAGAVLGTQDKYVSQMKQELIGSVGTSYEPLLERYIGHIVVLETIKADKLIEYAGVLKDYTAEFIEIMDVNYKTGPDQSPRKSDIVIPRKLGIVRHLGE
jgi:hypothetical protein